MNLKNRPSSKVLVLDAVLALVFITLIVYLFEVKAVTGINFGSTAQFQEPQPLSLLYAVTSGQQQLGLGQRASLPTGEGMLFIFSSPGNYGFWMKDMHFPIDMIWMDQNFRITHIAESVSPDTYPDSFYPEADSLYVLETNAGYSQNNNLSVGETLDFVKNSLQNTQ